MIFVRTASVAAAALLAACTPHISAPEEAPLAFVTQYACGDMTAEIGVAGETMALRADGKTYELVAVETASGAKYAAAGEGPETSFWSKGENGLLVLEGEAYPECTMTGGAGDTAAPAAAAPAGIWTARGQEPGWILTIDGGQADFTYAYGEQNHKAALGPAETIEGGVRYAEATGGLVVTALARPCADVMSGLPYPETVTVALGDQTFQGCGGDPNTLLAGPEWVVEDINGAGVPDGVRATIAFDAGAGTVSGRTGCNSFGGDYSAAGEGLKLGEVMVTEMACAPAVMDTEQKFLAVLRSASGHSFDETGALIIHGAEGTRILARR